MVLFPEARGFTMYLFRSLFCSSSCSLKHVVSLCICFGVCFAHGLVPWSTWFHYAFVLEFGLFILLFTEARGFTMHLFWSLCCSWSCSLKHETRGFTMYLFWSLVCSSSCSLKHVFTLCICNGVCFIYSLTCMVEVVVFPPHLEYSLKECNISKWNLLWMPVT